MKKHKIDEFIKIVKSNEYKNELEQMAERIRDASIKAPNEATIESRFDCELFAFFKINFEPLGFEYNPIKEKALNTKRHISKGHADTAISTLVIEFKQPSTLTNEKQKEKALRQIEDYLKAIQIEKDEEIIEGFVTDGLQGCFISYYKGTIVREDFLRLSSKDLDRIIQNIISLKLLAFNAENLVDSFCNPPKNDGIAFELVSVLFYLLKNKGSQKTKMLFTEWKELFNLSHDDISKQQAIIDRKQSLENLLDYTFVDRDDEYLAMFALQTAYAIIVKMIAYKVISQIRFNKSLINFTDLLEYDSEPLRIQFENLENGDIFRQYGMTNLLEGDFFAWYCSAEQWNEELAKVIKEVSEVLCRYSGKAVLNNSQKSKDFFKKLYEAMVPAAVRHAMGEYYTRKWLAQNVVEEAIKLTNVSTWRGLDPCCGSGTFLNVMIDIILYQMKDRKREEILAAVLDRVKGIDLNPIAVLTARVNYFINISHLFDDNRPIDIPVYLGDSSYVPKTVEYDKVSCLDYVISTQKDPIEITVPRSMVSDISRFAQQMIKVETQVKNQNSKEVKQLFEALVRKKDLTPKIDKKIEKLSNSLVDLEKKHWDGIWARLIGNYLSTAVLGEFDIVVGNPPWVDWKSLPSGYRERIKTLCISRKLFSGDRLTGGINLNICALISNVVAENWLSKKGVLAFLMPEPLVFQQSYEGFRNFYMSDNQRMYFCKFTNWSRAGHPFKPVTQKFLTFYMRREQMDYTKGVETAWYVKKKGKNIDGLEELNIGEYFDIEHKLLAVCTENKNFFSSIESKEILDSFRSIGGISAYIGREGIEFYPQELMVFKLANLPGSKTCTCLKNIQNKKSKYKLPERNILLETKYLHPMIKERDIIPFHAQTDNYIVPFPYEKKSPRVPIEMKRLSVLAPKLAKYYNDNKSLILNQTEYNERIIGQNNADFYALARVGEYSYAKNYVVFRDNTKWAAAVVGEIDTLWGGKKRPLFQNHAVSICEDVNGNYITLDEAHYICGIMNSSVVYDYMMQSSDSRSFPIRPRIKIPKFDKTNKKHMRIAEMSKKAHRLFEDQIAVDKIKNQLSEYYLQILSE